MFTIKLYQDNYHQRIIEAESFTIIRERDAVEITLHGMMDEGKRIDRRYDLTHCARPEGWPAQYTRAIIENSSGKTTEVLSAPIVDGNEVFGKPNT